MRLIRTKAGVVGALSTAVCAAVTLGLVTPAHAVLSGSDWIIKRLPTKYSIGTGPAVSPVSCVAGTNFCVAVVPDMDNLINGGIIGQAALVTRDGVTCRAERRHAA